MSAQPVIPMAVRPMEFQEAGLPADLQEKLKAPLPPEAITANDKTPHLSSIKPAFVIERMNDVFGIGGYRTTNKTISYEKELRTFKKGTDKEYTKNQFVGTVHGTLEEKACKTEADRLYAKQKQHERNTQRLKDLMVYAVDALGGKVKTPLFSIYCQTSAAQIKVEKKEDTDLVEVEKTNPELVRTKREPNMEALKLLVTTDPKAEVLNKFIVSNCAGKRGLRIK